MGTRTFLCEKPTEQAFTATSLTVDVPMPAAVAKLLANARKLNSLAEVDKQRARITLWTRAGIGLAVGAAAFSAYNQFWLDNAMDGLGHLATLSVFVLIRLVWACMGRAEGLKDATTSQVLTASHLIRQCPWAQQLGASVRHSQRGILACDVTAMNSLFVLWKAQTKSALDTAVTAIQDMSTDTLSVVRNASAQ